MRFFITTKAYLPRCHTFEWLNKTDIDYTVVTHYKDQAKDLRKVVRPDTRIICTNMDGLCSSRNFILHELAKKNEWTAQADDNIKTLQAVHPKFYKLLQIDQSKPPGKPFESWREVYRHKGDKKLDDYFHELAEHCDKFGTVYGGFGSIENPFFRQRKWGYVRYVGGKLYIIKRVKDLEWKGVYAIDSRMSAEVVARFGRVVVNSYVHPFHKMYEPGGLGSRQERFEKHEENLRECVRLYPGLVERAKGANSALRFLRTTPDSVDRWRREHGFLED